jgi:hypothetical protein
MNKNNTEYINVAESVKNLKNIYKKTTFFASYGTSIFLFILITLMFFLFFSYYNVMNNIHRYRDDPSKYRCHPSVMPFAGYIYPHPGMTNSEFNRSNVHYCIKKTLTDMMGELLQPFEYVANILQQIHGMNFGFLQDLRILFSYIRDIMGGIFALLYSLLTNLFASLNNIIIYLSDAFLKSTIIITIGAYVANIMIYCMRIIAKFTLWGIIAMLLYLGAIVITITFLFVYIVAYINMSIVPIIGPFIAPFFSWGVAIAAVAGFLVTYIIICVIFGKVATAINIGLQVTAPEAPEPPRLVPPHISIHRRHKR